MKLHQIPEGSKIKADITDGEGEKLGAMITFHHLDGMFSLCTVDETGEVCHLWRNQELTLSEEGYYELV